MRAQMELMSSLLFCALVAHLSQALERDIVGLKLVWRDVQEKQHVNSKDRFGTIVRGCICDMNDPTRCLSLPSPQHPKQNICKGIQVEHGGANRDLDIKFNNSMIFRQMPMQKKILLNINGPPLVNMISDMQVVFMDINCKKCLDCMERAIKAYKSHYYIVKTRPRTSELHEEVLNNRHGKSMRMKRETLMSEINAKSKKNKSKKKSSKSVTVTKYNVDGEVFALKVKEKNIDVEKHDNNDTDVSSCLVYSVKKTFTCDTQEADSFLTSMKQKANKKGKKEKDKKKSSTTRLPIVPFSNIQFRKRQVDNSQVLENFMPSLEEMY